MSMAVEPNNAGVGFPPPFSMDIVHESDIDAFGEASNDEDFGSERIWTHTKADGNFIEIAAFCQQIAFKETPAPVPPVCGKVAFGTRSSYDPTGLREALRQGLKNDMADAPAIC
jgi:hypothetical protein